MTHSHPHPEPSPRHALQGWDILEQAGELARAR